MRIIILPVVLVLTVGVGSAAADPIGTPAASTTYTVTCLEDGQQTTFHVVGTGAAGHVLENDSIAVLLSADVTRFVDGVLDRQFSFSHPEQANLQALTCSLFTEFVNAGGQTIRFEYENARIILTPPTR
jgi:hypothetical protein